VSQEPEPPAEGGDRERQPLWARLIAPLRSEAAAFRVVLWAGGAAIALAIVATLVRAVS
jgi:hypothetical protein